MDDPLNLVRRALVRLYSLWVSATYPFASLGSNLSIHFGADVSKTRVHRMKWGNSVTINKDATVRVELLLDETDEPVLVIEDECIIGPRCAISAKNSIYLERDVVLAPSVLIQDHSHAYKKDVRQTIRHQGITEGGRIRIGQGSWIGQGSVIHCDQGELTLGRNCVVAPNSLVNRSFPAYSLIAGNPAHVIKQFDAAKGAWVLGSSRRAETEIGLPQAELQASR
jgi:acetyltransferase-like isoleucine patch superfamily enzyme